jgi:hypothetical protein
VSAVTHGRRRSPLSILAALSVLFLASATDVRAAGSETLPASPVTADIDQAEKNAAQWLLGQMVPNQVVPQPSPGRRRLVLSYRVPAEDPAFRYIYGRSFTYDNALAAVSLTMLGRYREAEYILNAMGRLLRPDGSLWFAYNTQNNWPDEADHDGALIRSGANAWAGYAFTYYLEARSRENPGFPTTDTVGMEYVRAARSIASSLLARQVTDRLDPRFGLITGGVGSSTVTMDSSSKPAERYDPAPPQWVSTEHNIDAWFFLRDLAQLTSAADIATAADSVRARLATLWSEKDGQFRQGIHEDRTKDTVLPLDGASWGALFLMAQGRREEAMRCVEAMQHFSAQLNGAPGYRPYGPAPVYADEAVNRFFFPDAPSRQWQDLPFIWGEGSFGAAAALIRTGSRSEGLRVLDSLRTLAVDGGFRYASTPVQYEFNDYPSVASTAWFIIAVELLRGGPAADAFWGP